MPDSSPQTVLLAVTGMSPAVLTETIWALAKRAKPIIPHRVIALTTSSGARCIREQLLTPNNSKTVWGQLQQELGSRSAKKSFDRLKLEIREFQRDAEGTIYKIDQLQTHEDHLAVADCILNALWELVPPDRNLRVIASIAGGFKSMSALLLSCMSLLGRPEDEITHVLVSEPYDNPMLQPRFYFPAQDKQTLSLNGKDFLANNAKIQLAVVPFVALRTIFEAQTVDKPSTYSELVGRCRNATNELNREPISIDFNSTSGEAAINNIRVSLRHKDWLFFEFLCRHNVKKGPLFDGHQSVADQLAEFMKTWSKPNADIGKWNPAADDIRKRLENLKNKFRKAGLEKIAKALFPPRGRVGFPANVACTVK